MGYTHLMHPVRIGKHLIKNRIIAAPVTMHSASNGESYPTEMAINFFVQRARAGAGIVVCAGAKLLPNTDDGQHANWDLYKHQSMHKLAELAEQIHFYGAKASMELIGIFEEGYVASEGGLLMDGMTPGREIPISEMMRYKEGYAHCAEKLMELGFDGILLHFGHSIPIAQFLSPLTNKRTDQYGGSFENRIRYIVEILQAIRKRVGDNMIIEIRMSASEFKEGGIDLEEGLKIAEVLQEYADIIQASCGMVTPELMCRTHPGDFLEKNPNVYLAEYFKRSGRVHVPVTALGGIGSLEDADKIIAEGKADFVAISRAFIADPDLIPKSIRGEAEDVVPCIKCMRCHDSTVFGHFFRCSVNPTIGLMHQLNNLITPTQDVKKVAVIGGGPAGMYAALTASKRGHEVTLYEATNHLGGAINFAVHVPFKRSLTNFRNYLVNQIEKSSVQVCLGVKVDKEMLEDKGYDAVITAIGAMPIVPPIKGVESARFAIDVYGKEETLGEQVIIIGGGQVGCESALHLAKKGKQVTVIEMGKEIIPDASITHRGEILAEMSKEPNLTFIMEAKCIAITNEGIRYEKVGEIFNLEAQSVILATGMKAKTEEVNTFVDCSPYFTLAGDCLRARTVEMAVREGYFAAINL